MRIVDAMNTYNPALHVITALGYALEIDPSNDEDSIGFWIAKKTISLLKRTIPSRYLDWFPY